MNHDSKNDELLYVSFMLKTLEMLNLVLLIAYQFSMVWLIFVQYYQHKQNLDENAPSHKTNFYISYGFADKSHGEIVLISLYFAFTSLSTVGFGDYHPQNSGERIFCTIFIVLGVMIFSYAMGVFIEMLNKFLDFSNDYNDNENLDKFINTIQKFNSG